MEGQINDKLWGVHNVAEYLGLSVSSIYKMTCRKAKLRIPHFRVQGHLRFRKQRIDEWLVLLEVSGNEVLSLVRERAARYGKDS